LMTDEPIKPADPVTKIFMNYVFLFLALIE